MTWLVTGGAGYIGAHTVWRLRAEGHRVVVLDDLSTGTSERLPADVPLIVGSVTDREILTRLLREYDIVGVAHLAARKSASESVIQPLYYYQENVCGLLSLLTTMVDMGVPRIVFSSSAAVYGTPATPVVTEQTPTMPVSPYGHSKLVGEQMLAAVAVAHHLDWIALRYFNAVGTDAPHLGDHGATNLFPLVFQALSSGEPLTVAGIDYPTRDGTGVRDYVHVADLADAHVAAVRRLAKVPRGERVGAVYNVGTGHGHSVLEVLATVEAVTGRPVPYTVGPRRPGDSPEVVASTAKINRELGWTARRDLVDMVRSAGPSSDTVVTATRPDTAR